MCEQGGQRSRCKDCARSVEAVRSVSMGDDAVTARTVEAVRSVSMGDGAVGARIADLLPLVPTLVTERCVKGQSDN